MIKVMTDRGLMPADEVLAEVEKKEKWVYRERAVELYGGGSSYFSTWYQKHDIPTIGHRNNKRWDAEAILKAKPTIAA